MKLRAIAPVGGYTPGQVINLEIDVINESDQPVSDFTVQLIKVIKEAKITSPTANEQFFSNLSSFFLPANHLLHTCE